MRPDGNGFVMATDAGEQKFYPAQIGVGGEIEVNPSVKDVAQAGPPRPRILLQADRDRDLSMHGASCGPGGFDFADPDREAAVTDIYPPTVQRPALLKFAEALGCRDNALRRDECGDWRIQGHSGHIYAVPGSLDRRTTPGFQICVQCELVRQWSYAKKAFKPFTDLTNDGDECKGMLFLDRLPTLAEAETIREYVGIAKKRVLSEEDGARQSAMGHRFEKRSDAWTPRSARKTGRGRRRRRKGAQ